jgi:hypothetical protein
MGIFRPVVRTGAQVLELGMRPPWVSRRLHSSNYSAAVGCGRAEPGGYLIVRDLRISDSKIIGYGGRGGVGWYYQTGTPSASSSQVRLLSFSEHVVLDCRATYGSPSSPVSALSVVLGNSSLLARATGSHIFGVAPSSHGWFDLTILYGSVTALAVEKLSDLNLTFIYIGNIALPQPSP